MSLLITVAVRHYILVKKPVLQLDERLHDFGAVMEGRSCEYVFRFRNTGESDLEIEDYVASCGCTVVKFDEKRYPPQCGGFLKVSFDSTDRIGTNILTVMIVSNAKNDIEKITLRAKVVKDHKISPRVGHF